MPQGASLRRGEVVLRAGHTLRAIEIGLLAEVGAAQVLCRPHPSVAILSTGDELVPCESKPRPGLIRNSNGAMLEALVQQVGALPVQLGIARDRREELTDHVQRGLQHDVLVVSGGVSAGVLDLVPEILEQLGVQRRFHLVRLKPGKPLWFGVKEDGAGKRLVFGLPGNPVSSLVCFVLFVRPVLARLAGRTDLAQTSSARLARDFVHRGDRPTYHPARLLGTADEASVDPLDWKGSADLRTLAEANCLARFPEGERQFAQGSSIDVILL
jgi:molybdopterin molybdotransferase